MTTKTRLIAATAAVSFSLLAPAAIANATAPQETTVCTATDQPTAYCDTDNGGGHDGPSYSYGDQHSFAGPDRATNSFGGSR